MKRRSMARIAASGAVLAACSAMGLPQAEAQSHTPAARLAPANASSTSKAGYLLASAPTPASANDKFKVPTLTCPPTGDYGIALGAFLFTSSGLSGGEVTAECSSGTASYAGVVFENGENVTTPFTPAAGDVIKAQGSETATTASGGIFDVTQRIGDVFSNSGAGAASSSVFIGMEALVGSSNTQLPVPPFGRSRFTIGMIDGGTVLASGAVARNMNATGHLQQIHTSALNSTGKAWTESFKNS
jgi:hypothetical protein